ncbi:release factor glutamine methyltransferase [Nematocida homosporus]|uniref:release factor glutamine methyltransferase n=1 Tax=Nematocida homosporus TaxID=1912981 RepID=UPI00221E834A|nr:release factor glutamine methyltransferase [Nematocida homosporus]KAI5185262.1 release factor glutamine methyltransferase [Nematocida homosporus]
MHHVYPPDEDTFLLEDAIMKDLAAHSTPPKIIVEVGSGSGYISRVLAQHFPTSFVLATDINPYATTQTQTTLLPYSNASALRTSIIAGIKPSIDLAIFNPPYLPSEPHHLTGAWIDRSWAGGVHGLEVTQQFLLHTAHVPIRYLLLCSLNNPQQLADTLSTQYHVTLLVAKKVLSETLVVLKIESKS